VLEVFDGKRGPTEMERVQAVLRGVPVGEHVHLLARDERRQIGAPAIASAERDADLLGCELLAPAEVVLRQTRRGSVRASRREAQRVLVETFGLPAAVAGWYAGWLYPSSGDPLLRRLGIFS
jgi:hypothetical protein